MTKQEAIDTINASFPSIWSREDVLQLVNRIDEVPSGLAKIDKQIVKDLTNAIMDEIKENARNLDSSDVCDLSSAEFELNYNEISLSSVDLDNDSIAENVVCGIADVIEEFFEKLEEESNNENEED